MTTLEEIISKEKPRINILAKKKEKVVEAFINSINQACAVWLTEKPDSVKALKNYFDYFLPELYTVFAYGGTLATDVSIFATKKGEPRLYWNAYGLARILAKCNCTISIAEIVYENDPVKKIKSSLIDGKFVQTFEHEPLLNGDKGEIIGSYCAYREPGGTDKIFWLSREELDQARRDSTMKDIWEKNPLSMMKTVTVRKCAKKLLPFLGKENPKLFAQLSSQTSDNAGRNPADAFKNYQPEDGPPPKATSNEEKAQVDDEYSVEETPPKKVSKKAKKPEPKPEPETEPVDEDDEQVDDSKKEMGF